MNLPQQTRREDIREYYKRMDEKLRKMRNVELDLLRECIPGTEKLTRPQLLTNAANYIQQLLNPNSMAQDQVKIPGGYNRKDHRENNRVYCQGYRNVMKEGYNLLRKWVPGTSTLSRVELLKRTVKYIQELEQRSPVKKIKLETSQNDTDSAQPLRPHRSFTSEMVDGTVVASTPMEIGASESVSSEEFLRSPEELLANPEELPELNNMEDFIQWLEL